MPVGRKGLIPYQFSDEGEGGGRGSPSSAEASTRKLSLAQAPKSNILQRSLQNGR